MTAGAFRESGDLAGGSGSAAARLLHIDGLDVDELPDAVRKTLERESATGRIVEIESLSSGSEFEADVQIDGKSWDIPAVFPWLKKLGKVTPAEMYRVFNMGIGMVLIVRSTAAARIGKIADEAGVKNWRIGEVVKGRGKVKITNRRTKS